MNASIEVLSSKEHIERNISMYAGDISNKTEIYYDFEGENFKSFNFNGALVKIYSEIVDNSLDHVLSSNIDSKKIYVNISDDLITVANFSVLKVFGDVKCKGKIIENCCRPKYIIEKTFSSTKFKINSKTIGIHGLGIKILPVLCKYLEITVSDGLDYYKYIKDDETCLLQDIQSAV